MSRSYHDLKVVPYEQQLDENRDWAMTEGSMFFEGRGRVQESLQRITKRLNELGVAYAISRGMALYLHGYRRFTEDVDILVTREGLNRIHQELDGLGYVRPFEKSKNLRDSESGVQIEFLVTGAFPGDGKPKEIAFPNPAEVAEDFDGIRVLNLPTLISLKIASGLTGAGRSRDIGDVEELIRLLNLQESLAETLHPSVQSEYRSIWSKMHRSGKRYIRLWPKPASNPSVETIDDLIAVLGGSAATQLVAMRDDGVTLDPTDASAEHFRLLTTDPNVARKHGMQDESLFWELE